MRTFESWDHDTQFRECDVNFWKSFSVKRVNILLGLRFILRDRLSFRKEMCGCSIRLFEILFGEIVSDS